MDLNILWFLLLGVLLAGYAILDGFDLGVGVIHPFIRGDTNRRIAINSIGPLWDGNEVWLVTFGGALFAAFPRAYAAILSSFYLPVMLLLAALVGRAVSIEFRSKVKRPGWRLYWDYSFALSSATVAFVGGVGLGNVLRGFPLGPDGVYAGTVLDLLHPYPLLVGLLTVAGAALHGTIFLYLKTEGGLQRAVHRWIWVAFGIFAALYVAVSLYTLLAVPHATRNFQHLPIGWVVVGLNVLAVANIPRAVYLGMPRYAFISSCATIAALTFLVGMAIFPDLAPSSLDPGYSLDIYSAASSQGTLLTMAIIAAIGMPFVLTYTAVIYWVFRGKTQLDHSSY